MTTGIQKHTAENLQRLVGQIERLEEERKGLGEDIADKFKECRALGFDVKVLKQVLKLRKMTKVERDEAQAIIDTYLHALGDLADTPLGKSAIDRATKVHKIAKAHGITKDIADQVAMEG